MKQRIVTESGTEYIRSGRTVTRVMVRGEAHGIRHDDGAGPSAIFWGTPTVGHRMIMILEGQQFSGGSTVRTTTPIVSIEDIEE